MIHLDYHHMAPKLPRRRFFPAFIPLCFAMVAWSILGLLLALWFWNH